MPTRLPTPGQDHNQWGDILNNYLLVSHTPTGTLKPHTVGTTQLQDGAITTSHLQPSSVTTSTITPGAITEDTLAPSIITKLNTIAGQQGPKGDQGDKGDKGDTGDTGPIGPAGPQGTPGTPGTNGQDGAVGPQGPQGPAGATGAPGQDGATGPAGPQGPKGDKGDQGDAGPVGATGATGPQGPAGQGVPTGGATGQVLAKSSNINYATEWVTPAAAGGSTAWNDITGKPAVIAAGSSAANARTAIGAAPATGISLDATTDAADRLAMTANERTKLANLTGTVYVTTTGATLPGDLADGTLIARYTASGPATPVVTNVGSSILTTGSTTITVTTTAAIPVGDVIAVALNRGTATAGQVMGSAVVSLSGGAVDSWTRASASRAMTHDTALMVARVTSAIASGTTVTITTSTNGTNRAAAIVAGIHNLSSGAPNATSGDDAAGQDRDTNHGPNANGTSISAPTDAVTTVPHTLVLGAFGIGGTSIYTQGAGQTEIGQGKTEVGSADRGVAFGYKVVHSTGIQTMTLNSSISGGMTGVVVALPIELIEV